MEAIKELKKEFIKNKERFIQIGYNPQTEVYLYKRIFPLLAIVYEVLAIPVTMPLVIGL